MARALPLAYDFDEEAHGFGEPEETPPPPPLTAAEKGALALVALACLSTGLLLVEWLRFGAEGGSFRALGSGWVGALTSFPLLALGAALYFSARYLPTHPGIKHDGVFFASATSRGALGWIAGVGLTAFYVLLYWYPQHLEGLIRITDPLSRRLSGAKADQWFLYGLLYCLAVASFGVRTMLKYRHNRYQLVRTASVTFFQLGLAFLLPQLLKGLYGFDPYLTYFWPLSYSALFPSNVADLLHNKGQLGTFMLFWGLAATFIATPALTFVFGKRWYCSWVCGCGGLAETLGDGYRQLSDKSDAAWTIERGTIYPILGLIAFTTAFLWAISQQWLDAARAIDLRIVLPLLGLGVAAALGVALGRAQGSWREPGTSARGVVVLAGLLAGLALLSAAAAWAGWIEVPATLSLGAAASRLAKVYGFAIGAAFSGVIGVGFYPLLGSRVWCRFGCPMAAILGLIQTKLSRFRITTNGGQCISCGNCSTYCEMGIDVREYAQRGENIVRASCVGCGVCAAVCPRGVLKLENGSPQDRAENQRPTTLTGARTGPAFTQPPA